jgi:hypothetical protein
MWRLVCGFLVTTMMGTLGRYFETRRAVLPLVESTMMAPAFCSYDELTAAEATVSVVSVGRGVRARSSDLWGPYEMADSARTQVSCIVLTASVG